MEASASFARAFARAMTDGLPAEQARTTETHVVLFAAPNSCNFGTHSASMPMPKSGTGASFGSWLHIEFCPVSVFHRSNARNACGSVFTEMVAAEQGAAACVAWYRQVSRWVARSVFVVYRPPFASSVVRNEAGQSLGPGTTVTGGEVYGGGMVIPSTTFVAEEPDDAEDAGSPLGEQADATVSAVSASSAELVRGRTSPAY